MNVRIERDAEAKVAVLWGEGQFCAGADLKAIGTERQSRVEFALGLAAFPQSCLNVDRLSAIQGGVAALQAEGVAGAARFAGGAGRHGDFGR
jgi:enoyl-CoA hydratase/carnithine racemase